MTLPSLLLLGAGNMGSALLAAWLDEGGIDADRSAVVDPNPSDAVRDACERYGVAINPEADANYEVCVLAVKPQVFPAVLPGLDWPGIEDTLFVSIAAGVTVQAIRQHLAEAAPGARVVRTMPSLPSRIRRGITLIAGDGAAAADLALTERLMAAAGPTHVCETEDQLDQLMGATGCSPAFVFLLAEALSDALRARGVDEAAARRLGEAAVTGAAAMLADDGRDAASLRRAVTSPGGTTQAALDRLDARDGGLRPLTDEAVQAAYARAKELAS